MWSLLQLLNFLENFIYLAEILFRQLHSSRKQLFSINGIITSSFFASVSKPEALLSAAKQRDIKNSVTYDLDLATRRPAMGKRASKLKPEEVDDLKAHTYCKYFVCCPRFFVVVLFSTQEPFLVK